MSNWILYTKNSNFSALDKLRFEKKKTASSFEWKIFGNGLYFRPKDKASRLIDI